MQYSKFKLETEYVPTGDQPQAIEALVAGINSRTKYQTLLGVTGSGKVLAALASRHSSIPRFGSPNR